MTMDIHSVRRAAVLTTIGALVVAPGALGKGQPVACPGSDLAPCFKAAIVPKDQRVRLAPRLGLDGRGQQVWRAGNHLMQ
jgi:hypothetical protein